jgi:hypothetical protein
LEVQVDELTVEKVTEVFRGLGVRDESTDRMTIGAGLLHCGTCDGLLYGGHGSRSWAPGTPARYDCGNCDAVSVMVHRVDGQLQKLTQQRLEAHEFVRRWRENRATELDARISEGHRIRAWCLDPVNHKQVARVIGGPLGIGGRGDVAWGLIKLAEQMITQVEERATLAGRATTGAALLAELPMAEAEYTLTYHVTRRGFLMYSKAYKRRRRQLTRVVGGRKQLEAHVRHLNDRLWDLLAETQWRDAGPAQLPALDKAMEQDWATSSTTMVRRRHELVRLALDEKHRLAVDPDANVRVVPNAH